MVMAAEQQQHTQQQAGTPGFGNGTTGTAGTATATRGRRGRKPGSRNRSGGRNVGTAGSGYSNGNGNPVATTPGIGTTARGRRGRQPATAAFMPIAAPGTPSAVSFAAVQALQNVALGINNQSAGMTPGQVQQQPLAALGEPIGNAGGAAGAVWAGTAGGTVQQPRRRGGRPKGSRNKATLAAAGTGGSTATGTAGTTTGTGRRRRGRPAKASTAAQGVS